MGKPESNASSMQWATLVHPELLEVTYLRRALEIAENDGLGVERADVQRVEAMWSIGDGDWTALGFVLLLHDGRHVYLDYDFDFAGDSEAVNMHRMNSASYPAIENGGVEWSNDVGELNRLLMS